MARKSRKKLFGTDAEINEKKDSEKETSQIYNVAIYARLSVVNDTNEESIDNQIAIIKEYIEKYDDLRLVEIYSDSGKTGTNFSRPAFEEMMEDIKKGKINCIIVKDLSRFGRNFIEAGNYIERIFPYLGIRFISINDNYDTNSSNKDDFIISFKNLVNEFYAKDISNKIKAALLPKQLSGKFLKKAPYGYKKLPDDKYKLVIDPETAVVVKRIFGMFISGKTVSEIVSVLNMDNVLTPTDYRAYSKGDLGNTRKSWSKSIVRKILANPVYAGITVAKRYKKISPLSRKSVIADKSEWIIVKNTHESIITEDIFDKVQNLKKGKDKNKNSYLRFDKKIFCTNLFFCGNCGCMLNIYSIKNSQLFCRNHDYYGNFVCDNHTNISEISVKKVMFEFIKKIILLNYNRYLLTDSEMIYDQYELKEILEKKEKQISDIEMDSFKLFEDYSVGILSKDEYKKKKKTLDIRKTNILSEIKKLTDNKIDKSKKEINSAIYNFSMEDMDADTVKIFIKRINIYKGGTIEIIPNFTDFLGGNKL